MITQGQLITALKKNAGQYSLAAQDLGITRQAVRQRVEKDPELKQMCIDLGEQVTDVAEAVVIQSIVKDKNREDAKWWLERRGRARGFGHRVDHGGRVQFDITAAVGQMTDEQIDAALRLRAAFGEAAEPGAGPGIDGGADSGEGTPEEAV